VEAAGSAVAILEREQGRLTDGLLETARNDLERWTAKGLGVHTVLDADYPGNLRAAPDRPPLIFVAGEYRPEDRRSVSVIGARSASRVGLERAHDVAAELVSSSYTVVSGLAAGVDTAAHTVALDRRGRTIAVIGTGVQRCYPAQNAPLQRRIASEGAVISQFLPEAGPSRTSFPKRNAVMSGLTVATVVIEASPTSGARTQVRFARAQNRPVFLAQSLVEQTWAGALLDQPGIHVFDSPREIVDVLEQLGPLQTLVA
jgi:DNA processing protein